MIVGGTQWMLRTLHDHAVMCSSMPGPQSMLLTIGVRKPVSRLLRGDCSDQHCGPERAWWVGQLGMLEY